MEYDYRDIEKKWQKNWKESGVYNVSNISAKPKFYVLDMFPYPSGSGLHVGHPLGYIASDIYARYKRLKGFNVLHPMGYDSFGLPAEQYALETGQHPATTTQNNIETFRQQLENIGFSFDWSREIRTSDPSYYKWTQWIFLQIFNSWFDKKENKARRIEDLIEIFEQAGNMGDNGQRQTQMEFSANKWINFSEEEKQNVLMDYRLAYSAYGEVNWCEVLGTVLANDEVVNGVSERGGHPVVKKKMRQWYMRITDYAERLLDGLEKVDFSDAMKEMQRNWIGKSEGAEIEFSLTPNPSPAGEASLKIKVYTTRPDTIFGVDFMVLAPEHELVKSIVTEEQRKAIDEYLTYVKSRSDRERMAEVKQITGCFTGAYALNPFDGRKIPVWIAEYVLAGYGTGAIMAVPCGDQRDFDFATHFNIPVTNIIGDYFNGEEANPTKEATLINSGFLNGIKMKDAINILNEKIEEEGIGHRKVNYKMRDAGFSRQRYWGEPFPIIYKNGVAYPVDIKELPVELPHVENYSPGPDGQGPLANITDWFDLTPSPSPRAERGEVTPDISQMRGSALVSKYKVSSPRQYELARGMRKDYTTAENKLWQSLRNSKLGVKFRRQHPIESYIVDFISLQDNLIVEVDGGYHESEGQKAYDEERTKLLTETGFHVIRFSNEEVLKNLSSVLNRIQQTISAQSRKRESAASPSPLAKREGVRKLVRETNTMPGYAGSSWYFLRYMDPHNDEEFADKKATDYWNQVDVYVGGTEHAVGHLLYSRMWTKVLYDLGFISFDEPFKKLVNQGMIGGISEKIIRAGKDSIEEPHSLTSFSSTSFLINWFPKKGLPFILDPGDSKSDEANYYLWNLSSEIVEYSEPISLIKAPINFVENGVLNIEEYIEDKKNKLDYYKDANEIFLCKEGYYNTKTQQWSDYDKKLIAPLEFKTIQVPEKMSKRHGNVINPDDIINKYGADTFRMYEMFLGPVEQSKPWDTKGIEGVHRFLKKLWRLFFDDLKGKVWSEEKVTPEELKVLHKAIKKIGEDTERFSYNTAVSAFMVCVNELHDLKCHKKEILEPLLILLAPYAPHIAEELFHELGNSTTIIDAHYPKLETKYLVESEKEYPVSINGKMRTKITMALDVQQEEAEKIALNNEVVKKWIEGKPVKKIIFVKGKMVNVVV